MYGCESWSIKKAEHRRIDAFELWCWRRLLRVPWTARSSNQSILKEISPEYSLEWLMLKLKLNTLATWCEQLTHWKRPSDAVKDWWRQKGMTEDEMVGWHHWLYRHEFEQSPRVGDGQGSLACCSPWGGKDSDMTERLNWLTDWLRGKFVNISTKKCQTVILVPITCLKYILVSSSKAFLSLTGSHWGELTWRV